MNSFELLRALKNEGYLKSAAPKLWWPNAGSFEVVIGSILTQQTKWSNVEISLSNLSKNDLLSLENLSKADIYHLSVLIKPSGFAAQKASRLVALAKNIAREFGSFESFKQSADREWLLAQKGLGRESADAILCYACLKEVMVVDAYAARLLGAFGYEFESYDEIQEWFTDGVLSHIDKAAGLYDFEADEHTIFARFHGKIVDFCKEHSSGKSVDISSLEKWL